MAPAPGPVRLASTPPESVRATAQWSPSAGGASVAARLVGGGEQATGHERGLGGAERDHGQQPVERHPTGGDLVPGCRAGRTGAWGACADTS